MDLDVLHESFYTLKEIFLGRLVTDIKNPADDFWPDIKTQTIVAEDDYIIRPYDNLKLLMNEMKNADISAKLTRLVSGSVGTGKGSSTQLSTAQAKVYNLLNSSLHFERLCRETASRVDAGAARRPGGNPRFAGGRPNFPADRVG